MDTDGICKRGGGSQLQMKEAKRECRSDVAERFGVGKLVSSFKFCLK